MNSKSKAENKQKQKKPEANGSESGNAYLSIFQRRQSGSLNRDLQDSLGQSNNQIYENLDEPIDYGVPALLTDSDRRLCREEEASQLPDSKIVVEKFQLLLELEYPNKPKLSSMEEKWEAVMQIKREKCKRSPEYHFKALSTVTSSFPRKPKKSDLRKLETKCVTVCCELKADMIKGHISYVNDLQKVGVFYQMKVLLQRFGQVPKLSPGPITCALICIKNSLYRSEKTRNKMITFEISEELVQLFYAFPNSALHPMIFECIALIASCSSGTNQLLRHLISGSKESVVKVSSESRVRCEDGIVPFIVWFLICNPKLEDLDLLRVKLQVVATFCNLLSNCVSLDQRVFIIELLRVHGYDFDALEKCLENLSSPADDDHEVKHLLNRLDELIGKTKVQHIDVQQTADRAVRAEARNEVLRDEINQLEQKLDQCKRKLSWAMDEIDELKKKRIGDSTTSLDAKEEPAPHPTPAARPKVKSVQQPVDKNFTPPPPPPPPPPSVTRPNSMIVSSDDPVYIYFESVYEKLKVDYTGMVSSQSQLPACHWEPLYSVEGTLFEAAKQEAALKDLDISEFQRKFGHTLATSKGKMYNPKPVASQPQHQPSGKKAAQAGNDSAQPHELLSSKTAQNLIISKRRLHADDAEICEAIERIDTRIVTGEMADILYKFLPSSRSELKLVAKNKSRLHQLGEADQFYVRLACIERVPNKLQVIAFLDSFAERCADCSAKIDSLTHACIKSLECKHELQKILTYFLVLGNYMNSGRKRYAPGFRLTSLETVAKISDTSGKATVLDFVRDTVCQQFQKEQRTALMQHLAFEPPKVSLPSLSLEVEQLEKGLSQLKEECAGNESLTSRLNSSLEAASKDIPALVCKQQAAYNLYHQLCGLLGEDAAVTEPDRLFTTLLHFLKLVLQEQQR